MVIQVQIIYMHVTIYMKAGLTKVINCQLVRNEKMCGIVHIIYVAVR